MSYRNLPEVIQSLTACAADLVEQNSDRVVRVDLQERSDGSGRWAVTVTFQHGDRQYGERVTAPAPADAPPWAQVHSGYSKDGLTESELSF